MIHKKDLLIFILVLLVLMLTLNSLISNEAMEDPIPASKADDGEAAREGMGSVGESRQ